MSRRTAEANKAIAAAWQAEQQLVREGKGTRDWTPEQQQDILNRGKAYDDDGKAFEGHHMKSVEKYPDYQGNPENIQFLTRSEHCEAHNGKFQNPTNGYFNPATGETQDFGEKSPKPCKSIELSNPVVCKKATNGNLKEPSEPSIERSDVHPDTSISHQAAQLTEDTGSGGLIQFGRKVVKGFAGFATEHPILTGLAVAAAAGGHAQDGVGDEGQHEGGGGGGHHGGHVVEQAGLRDGGGQVGGVGQGGELVAHIGAGDGHTGGDGGGDAQAGADAQHGDAHGGGGGPGGAAGQAHNGAQEAAHRQEQLGREQIQPVVDQGGDSA